MNFISTNTTLIEAAQIWAQTNPVLAMGMVAMAAMAASHKLKDMI